MIAMEMPVLGPDGHKCEQHAISAWLLQHGNSLQTCCHMSVDDSTPNRALADLLPNISKASPTRRLRKQEGARVSRSMLTINEETKYDIEEERNIIPHISLQMTATASTVAMSIINNEKNRKLISVSDSVNYMVTLLQYGNDKEKEIAACALHRLAAHKENRSLITQGGSIPPLLELIRNGTVFQKNQALAAITSLAVRNDINKLLIARAGGIAPLLRVVQKGTDTQQSLAMRALYCLSKNEKIRDEVYRTGGIALIVEIVELTLNYETGPDLKKSAIATLKLFSTKKSIAVCGDH